MSLFVFKRYVLFFCGEQHGALQILYKGACPLPKAHPLKNYDDSVCELPQQLEPLLYILKQ